jgi:hypothetical protein
MEMGHVKGMTQWKGLALKERNPTLASWALSSCLSWSYKRGHPGYLFLFCLFRTECGERTVLSTKTICALEQT